jgi:hypothetical protein
VTIKNTPTAGAPLVMSTSTLAAYSPQAEDSLADAVAYVLAIQWWRGGEEDAIIQLGRWCRLTNGLP